MNRLLFGFLFFVSLVVGPGSHADLGPQCVTFSTLHRHQDDEIARNGLLLKEIQELNGKISVVINDVLETKRAGAIGTPLEWAQDNSVRIVGELLDVGTLVAAIRSGVIESSKVRVRLQLTVLAVLSQILRDVVLRLGVEKKAEKTVIDETQKTLQSLHSQLSRELNSEDDSQSIGKYSETASASIEDFDKLGELFLKKSEVSQIANELVDKLNKADTSQSTFLAPMTVLGLAVGAATSFVKDKFAKAEDLRTTHEQLGRAGRIGNVFAMAFSGAALLIAVMDGMNLAIEMPNYGQIKDNLINKLSQERTDLLVAQNKIKSSWLILMIERAKLERQFPACVK